MTAPTLGYDPAFLSVPLAYPHAAIVDGAPGDATRELPFVHFTVTLDVIRRLASVTGVNLDGARIVDVARGDDWQLDPRVPADQQTGPEVYADNDLDRGHLVRRRDPVWGDVETATQANADTFRYVNAAPQAALFNQGELLWSGLEDYVLGHAQTYALRLSVFTAPIFAADDPPYRGIAIPRRFWKIAAWADTAVDPVALAATGYVLDQSPQLDLIDWSAQEDAPAAAPPPLGAYLTYQVPIVDIATLTGLDLGPLPAADRMPAPAPVSATDLSPDSTTLVDRWRPLTRLADVLL